MLAGLRANLNRWLAPAADTPPLDAPVPVVERPALPPLNRLPEASAAPAIPQSAPVAPIPAPSLTPPQSAPVAPSPQGAHAPRPLFASGELDAAAGVRISPPAQPGATSAHRIGVARVLLAEDNAVNQKLALIQLQRLGCMVDVAGDGQEALALLAHHAYALILMDCNMPVMDGFAATRAIRAKEASTGEHLPIIAVTANALIGDRERCLAAGMDDYLSKPVRFTALQQTLAQWLPPVEPGAPDDDAALKAFASAGQSAPQAANAAAIPPNHADESLTESTSAPMRREPALAQPGVSPSAAPASPAPAVEAAKARRPALPALDGAQIEALRALETPEEPTVLRDILDEFRTLSGQLVATLQRALTVSDVPTLYETAHSLKSCSAYVGAWQVSAWCEELEAVSRNQAPPLSPLVRAKLVRLIADIHEAHEQALIALAGIEVGETNQEARR